MCPALRREVFAHLEQIMDRLNCGLTGGTLDGKLSFINQRLLDGLGYAREEVVGKPISELLPPEIQDRLGQEREAALAGDVRMRLTMLRRKDSTTFPVLVVPQLIINEEGQAVGSFSIILDMGGVETAKPVGYHTGDELHEKLERIARELQTISKTSALPGNGGALPADHPALAELSDREREVLSHLMSGARVPAIAKALFISPHTVRGHLKSVFRKVGVANQSELVEHVQTLNGVSQAPTA